MNITAQITGGDESKLIEDIILKTELSLKKSADIIKDDIKNNLVNSTGLDGKGLIPLRKKYRDYKAKYYGHTDLFWGKTGLLRRSPFVEKISKLEYHIKLKPNRAMIGTWINDGTNKMPSREFFGISKRVTKLIESIF